MKRTPRQQLACDLRAQGKSPNEIAKEMRISRVRVLSLLKDGDRREKTEFYGEFELSALNISNRASLAFYRAGIRTLDALRKEIETGKILTHRGIGAGILEEVHTALEEFDKENISQKEEKVDEVADLKKAIEMRDAFHGQQENVWIGQMNELRKHYEDQLARKDLMIDLLYTKLVIICDKNSIELPLVSLASLEASAMRILAVKSK